MKGAQYILVGLIVIVIGAFYLFSTSTVSHVEPTAHQPGSTPPPSGASTPPVFIVPSKPLPASATPTPAPISLAPKAAPFVPAQVPGIGFLTTPIQVGTQYGQVTFQRGTRLQIQGRDGNNLDVEAEGSEFSIDASLVSANPNAAPLPAGAPRPIQASTP